ncbi:MAG: VCBS repeat-containing protein, partial [Chloroflexi bacterium]|nr:VCBS repeat-containing protein [Chloroflexota bacterium]
MNKNLKYFGFILAVLVALVGFNRVRGETAVATNPNIIISWQHLSSDTADIQPPTGVIQQTATLIFDIDKDNDNDFVIAGRAGSGPSIVWYRRNQTGWTKYVIEHNVLDIEAGGAFYDIDGDGDKDIVMGGDNQSNKIWWWQNPAPNFDVNTAWQRFEIKNSGNPIHHDQIFADFDGDGQDEFVYWNQVAWNGNHAESGLFIAEIPADPTLPWPATRIYTGFGEGIAKADIDKDGQIDLLAGGRWFKHEGGTTYTPHVIDESQENGRIATGDFNEDDFIDVVMVLGDDSGPLKWYACTGDPTSTDCWQAENLLGFNVDHGHSLSIGDINQDGNQDIFVAEMRLNSNNDDAKMWTFFGDGAGDFELLEVASGIGNHESRLGDLDNDGDLDILGKPYNWETPRVDIWLNETNAFINDWERHVIDDAKPWRAIFVTSADMNGDDLLDVITGGWWYENPGLPEGTWARHTIGLPLKNMATVYDFDG